jgi:RNA polymerase sigma-70 factor (ECF subfamily)
MDPAELLRAIAERRDKGAFRSVFERFAPQIKRYLIGAGLRPSEAEELTQDVMLTVWRRAETFDPGRAAASTWIFTIARNRRIDALRQRRPGLDPQDLAMAAATTEAASSPREHLDHARRLEEALRALPGEQVEVLRCAYYEGKSMAAIAAEKSVPVGTVKSRYRLAMERLRAALRVGRGQPA